MIFIKLTNLINIFVCDFLDYVFNDQNVQMILDKNLEILFRAKDVCDILGVII